MSVSKTSVNRDRNKREVEEPMLTMTSRKLLLTVVALNLALGALLIPSVGRHRVEAAGPCTITPRLTWVSSRGVEYVDAGGATRCTKSNYQKVTTLLKRNGVVIKSATRYGWATTMSSYAPGPVCQPGATYQTVVVHQYGDGKSSPKLLSYKTTGAPYSLC